jgi:hypothetical protein
LQELDLAYADLMLVHRPPPIGFGQELWEGLIGVREIKADLKGYLWRTACRLVTWVVPPSNAD